MRDLFYTLSFGAITFAGFAIYAGWHGYRFELLFGAIAFVLLLVALFIEALDKEDDL
jgi:hypothetical protein